MSRVWGHSLAPRWASVVLLRRLPQSGRRPQLQEECSKRSSRWRSRAGPWRRDARTRRRAGEVRQHCFSGQADALVRYSHSRLSSQLAWRERARSRGGAAPPRLGLLNRRRDRDRARRLGLRFTCSSTIFTTRSRTPALVDFPAGLTDALGGLALSGLPASIVDVAADRRDRLFAGRYRCQLASSRLNPPRSTTDLRFKVVAAYTACATRSAFACGCWTPILVGAADTATPAAACEALKAHQVLISSSFGALPARTIAGRSAICWRQDPPRHAHGVRPSGGGRAGGAPFISCGQRFRGRLASTISTDRGRDRATQQTARSSHRPEEDSSRADAKLYRRGQSCDLPGACRYAQAAAARSGCRRSMIAPPISPGCRPIVARTQRSPGRADRWRKVLLYQQRPLLHAGQKSASFHSPREQFVLGGDREQRYVGYLRPRHRLRRHHRLPGTMGRMTSSITVHPGDKGARDPHRLATSRRRELSHAGCLVGRGSSRRCPAHARRR